MDRREDLSVLLTLLNQKNKNISFNMGFEYMQKFKHPEQQEIKGVKRCTHFPNAFLTILYNSNVHLLHIKIRNNTTNTLHKIRLYLPLYLIYTTLKKKTYISDILDYVPVLYTMTFF
jgi:hypothetical protein